MHNSVFFKDFIQNGLDCWQNFLPKNISNLNKKNKNKNTVKFVNNKSQV